MFPVNSKQGGQTILPEPIDTCITPTPGGPVPMPYPNIAVSEGARTGLATKQKVAITGKTAVTKGPNYSRSQGDETGTLRGVVSSSTMSKTQFMAGSAKVKMEGKNIALVNAPPPIKCGNPECGYHLHAIPATQTATLPPAVKVEFVNRLVCLGCYRKIVGDEPLPAGPMLVPSQTKVLIAS